MRLHVSTRVDPRTLSQPWHEIARQHPGRRRHVHGPLVPLYEPAPPRWHGVVIVTLFVVVAVLSAIHGGNW